MYDIYKTQRSWVPLWASPSLKNYFVIGGFETFEDTVRAIKELYKIDEVESAGRISGSNAKVFYIKDCTHVGMNERIRDTVAHNQIDRQHNPKAKLIDAYYGSL